MRQLSFDAVESVREFGFQPSAYREVALDNEQLDSEVLPLLSKLSHSLDERWLTCVDSPSLAKNVALAADIQPDKLLRVQASATLETTEVMKKALRAGLSHTVIGFCGELSVTQREELRQCAELADCQCLVLTNAS